MKRTGRRQGTRLFGMPPPSPPRHAAPRPAAGPPKVLRPLASRDFKLLWSGMSISLVGDGMFAVALPLQVLAIRDDPAALTYPFIAWNIPLVAFVLIGGVLSDRFDRRLLLILSVVVQGIALSGMGLLAVAGTIDLWHIVLLSALLGVGEALFWPAFGSIVPDIVPRDQLLEANSLDNLSRPMALRILGPALGGMAVALSSLGTALIIDAATFALATLFFLAMRVRGGQMSPQKLVRSEIREGLAYVGSKPWLWASLVSFAVGLLAFYGPWIALVPFIVERGLDGGEAGLSIVLAVGGFGALLAAWFIGNRDLPRRFMTSMFLTMSIGTLMLTAFGLSRTLWQAVIASFVMQTLFTAGIIAWGTTMHRLVPSYILGRVSSVDWMVGTSLIPVSLLLTGPLAAAVGARETLIGAGIVGALGSAALMFVPGARGPEEKQLEPALDGRDEGSFSGESDGGP